MLTIKHSYLIQYLIIQFVVSNYSYSQISQIRNKVFVGTRPIAMGEAFVAVANDINSIYWNPAGLPWVQRYEFMITHSNLFNSGVRNNYLALLFADVPFTTNIQNLAFGVDWFNISFDDDELNFSQNDIAFAVAYRIFNSFSMAGKAKFLLSNTELSGVSEGAYHGVGYDLGILYNPFSTFKLGIMVYDVDDTIVKYDNGIRERLFYQNVRYGISYQFKDCRYFKKPLIAMDIDDRFHLGAELWLQDYLALRAGVYKDIYENGEKYLTHTFGIGFQYNNINIDYAYINSPVLKSTNRISINLNFNIPISPIAIKNFCVDSIDSIYASLTKKSYKDSLADLKIENSSIKPIKYRIALNIKRFGVKADTTIRLMQKENKKNIKIALPLNIIRKTTACKMEATIASVALCTWGQLLPSHIITDYDSILIFGPGLINWGKGAEQVAAFVTPDDSSVSFFVENIKSALIRVKKENSLFLNENITMAALLINAIYNFDIKYDIGDAQKSHGPKYNITDCIKYPSQTINDKNGDCVDLSVLYASILEKCGVRTKLIDIPPISQSEFGHFFLMFDTGIKIKDRLILHLSSLDSIDLNNLAYDDRVWLPIETSTVYRSLTKACNDGVKKLGNTIRFARIIDTNNAMSAFPAIIDYLISNLKKPDQNLNTQLFNGFNEELIYYESEKAKFIESILESLKNGKIESGLLLNQYTAILDRLNKTEEAISLNEKILNLKKQSGSSGR